MPEDSEGLTAGLSKKPSSSTSSITRVAPLPTELTEAESSVSMSTSPLELFSRLLLSVNGARGSLRILQAGAGQGLRNRGSMATSPCGPLKIMPQHTFSFVHLDMSRNPETGIEGFRFRTKAGFFLLL